MYRPLVLPCTFVSIPGSLGKQGAWIYLEKLGSLLWAQTIVPALSNHWIPKPRLITHLNLVAWMREGEAEEQYSSRGLQGLIKALLWPKAHSFPKGNRTSSNQNQTWIGSDPGSALPCEPGKVSYPFWTSVPLQSKHLTISYDEDENKLIS